MADKIYYKMDGYPIETYLIEEFDLKNQPRNLRYSSTKECYVLNFVGFVFKNDKMLVVFPKNYTSIDKIGLLDERDMTILFNTLIKHQLDKNQQYMGEFKDYKSTYPFKSFFDIYKYYLSYGLYKEINDIVKPGYNGKVSWKTTIRKAQVIQSDNSFILVPLYVKKSNSDQVFLTECMAYVINYTINKFSAFLSLKLVSNINIQWELFKNKEFIISRLQATISKTFKDKEKKLISSLIDFFKGKFEGGDMVFKRYNFEIVWESMVEKYLNNYFVEMKNGLPVFNDNSIVKEFSFKSKSFTVNTLDKYKRHKIRPDHYYIDGDNQYIFDSKYYVNLEELNYKQIAYYSILKSKSKGNTFNALILPTSNKSSSEEYFELADEFYDLEGDRISIAAVHLNIKNVMEIYNKEF